MISIILSTHNGAARLGTLLDSFCHQENLDEVPFELIIVDNGSEDGTVGVVNKWKERFNWLRYVREDRLGINFARNCGIGEAQGDVLVFIDDDITFGPTWLLSYHILFDTHDEVCVAGGRVSCVIPGDVTVPKWLALKGEYSFPYITVSVELGAAEKMISFHDGIMPLGANMAIRREIFRRFGVFRTDLGLKGKSLMPGAEYEFFERLKTHRLSWCYVAEAHIFHPIKATQLSKPYFLKRTFGVGRVAAKTITMPQRTRKLGKVPLFCFRFLLESVCRYLLCLPFLHPQRNFYNKAQVYRFAGTIYEFLVPRNN